MSIVPTIEEAKLLLKEAQKLNPGNWIGHSKVAGNCAKLIAQKCNMDSDIAYSMGILHDIGRRFGVTNLKHVIAGYNFLLDLGYYDCARICITHSFPYKNINSFNGKNDCTKEETLEISKILDSIDFNDYDKLIQLCDVLSYPTCSVIIEKRLVDVALRYGVNEFTIQKWKAFFELKLYFDQKSNSDVYKIVNVSLY